VRLAGRRHWLLFTFLLATLVAMLLLQGVSAHTVGAAGTGSSSSDGPAPLANSGPVLIDIHGHYRSLRPHPGQVALSFDDGPSKRYTPEIIHVLRRYHVPGTFFLIGTHAVQFDGLVREEHRLGFEQGNHTYTHVNPAKVPRWEASVQADLTESVVGGITGYRPRLLRPPYSSTPDAVSLKDFRTYRWLMRRGYAIALATRDTDDWARPGVRRIVANGMPPGRTGAVILMHDGGGNRSETVRALPILIRKLRARDYRFRTVSGVVGIPQRMAEVPVSGAERVRGRLLVSALHTAAAVTRALTIVVLMVGVLTLARMALVLVLARRHARRVLAPADTAFTPPASIIVPAYNEEVDVERAVRSLAASAYPEFEVIVVDDGSTDRTAAIVEALGLPPVRLVRQRNAGKAAALNRGIRESRHDLVVMVDADTLFEPDTLERLAQAFRDPAVGAASGNTKVGSRRRLLGRWQHIEYVMGFNLDRRMYEMLDCMPTVPGAIGGFRREALAAVGGMSGQTLAEDTDVTLAIGRRGWRVVYVQEARAWTEAPATLSGLWKQRYRWAYGTLQSIWKHRAAFFSRERSHVGRRALPYLAVFQIALPFAAPLIDLFALYGLLFLHPLPVLAFWLGFNALQLCTALYAFHLDGESPRPLWAMPLQQFVYRQLMYLVVFQSAVSAARGIRLPWQSARRTGDVRVLADGA
jgi:cellulose synthase/poly-beta-1,6-N-acetylglucosamine synthase-like glycosyltransferase/peptidoglycan/xylan/chitin deacetylase (PgdA/CDA1 family)